MAIVDLLLIPLFWGLIGSVEPCSIGINSIFLSHINKYKKSRRILESLKFTLIRASVLALIGLSVAFAGAKFFTFQSSYNIALGFFYISLGIVLIASRLKPLPIPKIELFGIIKREAWARNNKTVTMGVFFGFAIPVCAVPFIAALLGKSLLSGDIFFGFVSLFILGTALSLPLFPLTYSKKGRNLLKKISEKAHLVYYVGGAALILLGIFTIITWFYVYPKYFPKGL